MARTKKEQSNGFIVLEKFQDRREYGNAVHEVGEDVSHFSPERLDVLVKRGLVKAGELTTDNDKEEE